MSIMNISRIEGLSKDNYDTWVLQMQALLIKNDEWGYVSGEIKKPLSIKGDPTCEEKLNNWTTNDNKAKADIILSICTSELKQIKSCDTSHDVWCKLKEIYQSKGPARKATLLKQLTLHQMSEGETVREHLNKFFDVVDKLGEMEVTINADLLTIMLLYSLPNSFENFRCAIESRDTLPTPEALRIKIIEESDARSAGNKQSESNAMYAQKQKKFNNKAKSGEVKHNCSERFHFQCYRCKKYGHKANECRSKFKQFTRKAEDSKDVDLFLSEALHSPEEKARWCLDSGATSHLCNKIDKFTSVCGNRPNKINLANDSSTDVTAKGTVRFVTGG